MEPTSLVLSYFSLGAGPMKDLSGGGGLTFEQRVVAARAGGFDGIGLWAEDYQRALAAGVDPASLRATADEHGVVVTELEVLTGWAALDPRPGQADKERVFHDMADRFGSRHLHIMGPYEGSLDDAAASFAGVCDRASDHGLLVSLEPMPFTNIADLGVALDIVERADRPNGGVCVDTWHHFRGANDLGLLRAIPAERIVSVQLNDGPLLPELDDYVADTITNRRAPGEGEFDLRSVLDELGRKGVRTPASVEVLSSELATLAPDVVARRLGDATRALLTT